MVVPDSEDSDEEFEAKTQKELQFEDLVHCCEKQVWITESEFMA